MNIRNMNINELLENILKRLRPIADQRRIDLILDSFRPVTADVDEVKFTLAISNLVENGIKYNVDEGWVRVTLDADHKDFYVTVADSGLGIPEDSIERIFERFYRVDKSHSRDRRNRSWTCYYKKFYSHASWDHQGIQQRGRGNHIYREDPAVLYPVLGGTA